MAAVSLVEIEQQISQLTSDEQLQLIGQLAQRLRQSAAPQPVESQNWDEQLAAMAQDPALQGESKTIEQEFLITEADGLEKL